MARMYLAGQDYYTSRSKKLLKDFNKAVQQVKALIIARYGETKAQEMIRSAGEEYRQLLPMLPYVGGEQPFTQFVIASGCFLALYRVMQAHGADVHETGELVLKISRTYLENMPGFARKLMGHMSFTPRFLRKLRQRAESSQMHPFPRGYVYSYVPGDGVNFDYGVDYHQCATWTFYQEQGAEALTPYLCACDQFYSELLGWGLMRTNTLGEGGAVCDFRFKRGGPTKITSTVLHLDQGNQ